jgi:magnesium-protoporphyrin O-methyltransferase
LDPTATRIAAFITGQGVDGASVLEIGGGVGAIQVELLARGAARTTNLELVDSYEVDARALAAEAGVAGRIMRRQLDIATHPELVEPHDVVVLHRVVCCYPDYDALLNAAAEHAIRALVFSYPPPSVFNRVGFGAENAWRRLRHNAFRTYLHDPDALLTAAQRHGLHADYEHRSRDWNVVGLTTN